MRARSHFRRVVVGPLLVLVLWAAARADTPSAAPAADDPDETRDTDLNVAALSAPPPVQPPVFHAPQRPPQPPPGQGRLRLELGGNRQWCTYRDDRTVLPPSEIGSPKGTRSTQDPIYTFGYQFTIAAVARARPAETIMLFESPVIRTAFLRQAAKLGRGGKKPPGPTIMVPHDQPRRKEQPMEKPTSIVPLWQELFSCASLPEFFDFDLDPGTYDVYMAFDILLRSGNWAHRSIGYLTDIAVEEGRRTRLEGRVHLWGGTRRDVDLLSATLLPAAESGAGAAP